MRSRCVSVCLSGFAVTVLLMAAGAACSTFSGEESPGDAVTEAGTADDAVAQPEAAPGLDATTSDGSTIPRNVAVLSSGHADLRSVVATETNAYFVARTAGVIYQVRLDGTGGVTEFYKGSPVGSPSTAALYDFTLYATDFGKGLLARKEEGGGPASTMPTASMLQPASVAVGTSPAGVRVVVLAMSANVGTVQQYSTELAYVLSASGTYQTPFDVAVTGEDVWWTESSAGKIWQGQLDQTQAALRVAGESGCESIAADSLGVYWTRPQDGLVRMMVPPQQTAASIAVNQISPTSIASDTSGVYWLTGDGKLQRSTRQTAEVPPQTLAKGFAVDAAGPRLRAIALTSKYVVWITGDGKVLRTDK